jgi:glycosyltransferase involved in cell wall biosynthesis
MGFMTEKRVLHVSDSYPGLHKVWGGAEMACKRYIDLLSGCEQYLVTLEPEQAGGELQIKHYSIKMSPQDNLTSMFCRKVLAYAYDRNAGERFAEIVREVKPDVIHFHRFRTLSWALPETAFKTGIKTVLSLYDCSLFCPKETLMHFSGHDCRFMTGVECAACLNNGDGTFLQRALWSLRGRAIKKMALKFDKITVLSESWLELLNTYGIPENRQAVIPLPLLDWPEPEELENKPSGDSILFVGWLQPRKGLLQLLCGFKLLTERLPQVTLTVVNTGGEPDYELEVKKYIEEFNLSGKVEIHGRKSPEELRGMLKNASVVAIPEQWSNPFPVFLCEAMSFACKIVASDIGGISSLIGRQEERGWLTEHNSAEGWAEKLYAAISSSDNEKGRRGRDFIINHCGPETVRNKLLGCYE